jgi:hypothetical protein
VTQQRINAQLGAMRTAEERERLPPADESGALWRMLSVLGVIAVVAVGSVLAIVAAGGLQ